MVKRRTWDLPSPLRQCNDECICENKLVVLLDLDKFEFIKVLMKNRAKIFYCTRIKQAQTDEERVAVEMEMLNDVNSEGPALLQQIKQRRRLTTDHIDEFASKARREARALNQGGKSVDGNNAMDEEASSIVGRKPLGSAFGEQGLNLDDLVFTEAVT